MGASNQSRGCPARGTFFPSPRRETNGGKTKIKQSKKGNYHTKKGVPRAAGAPPRLIVCPPSGAHCLKFWLGSPCWILGVLAADSQQAMQQTVAFESKWSQQAAAIREKQTVSLSFKPCVVYCSLFCLLFFIVFAIFYFLYLFFSCLFFFVVFLFFSYCLLVSNKMKHFAS